MTHHKGGRGQRLSSQVIYSQRHKVILVAVGGSGDCHKSKTLFDQEAEDIYFIDLCL
jgi:hypothetical protein